MTPLFEETKLRINLDFHPLAFRNFNSGQLNFFCRWQNSFKPLSQCRSQTYFW